MRLQNEYECGFFQLKARENLLVTYKLFRESEIIRYMAEFWKSGSDIIVLNLNNLFTMGCTKTEEVYIDRR